MIFLIIRKISDKSKNNPFVIIYNLFTYLLHFINGDGEDACLFLKMKLPIKWHSGVWPAVALD